MKMLIVIISLFCICFQVFSSELKEHEKWWTHNIDSYLTEFESWLGDVDAPSRVCARNYIKRMGYKTILDIPAGLCTEYFGYKKDEIEINYLGMDITHQLLMRGQQLGVPVLFGNIESIPCKDSSFEVCYARHILEHLPSYELALQELIRVAQKEVMVVFFIVPHMRETLIDPSILQESLLYHNRYNKPLMEEFILSNTKVSYLFWEYISDIECTLHIFLDQDTDDEFMATV